MSIDKYAVDEESIRALSRAQIRAFFERHESLTEEDCKEYAANIAGSPIEATAVQGRTSYTVLAGINGCRVVQFRDDQAPLNLELLPHVQQAYKQFVPGCEHHSLMRDSLHVYVMDRVPGVAFCIARHQLFSPENDKLLVQTTKDFARSVIRPYHACNTC